MTDEWLPPRRQKTFEYFVEKLRELQRKRTPLNKQLAVIDWWIGKLFVLKAEIQAGRRL